MKKIISILAAAAIVLTAAGCNGETDKEETTAASESSSGKTHTEVVYGEEDTTEEALAYLNEYIPLYVKFMGKRMQCPLTFETTITESGEYLGTSGIYIRDEQTIALSATDADGNTTRLIYMDGMVYQIETDEKVVYSREYSVDAAKSVVSDYLIKIKLSEVEKCTYVDDYEDVDGVTYKHEIIYQEDGSPSNYYYDENTDEIVFIRVGEQISKVEKLENAVDDSVFEIPADYEMKNLSENNDTDK